MVLPGVFVKSKILPPQFRPPKWLLSAIVVAIKAHNACDRGKAGAALQALTIDPIVEV
jgi:hypothetical protein